MNPCIASYLTLCKPYPLPAPWGRVEVDECCHQGPQSPAEALQKLTGMHSAESLVHSGLCGRDAGGNVVLHPSLSQPDVGMIRLNHSSTKQFHDLMTETGCVLSKEPPTFRVLADAHCFAALDGVNQHVFLTEQIQDAILLRSFGLAAAPLVGLDRLDQCGVELLGKYYGMSRSLSEREQDALDELEFEVDESPADSGNSLKNDARGEEPPGRRPTPYVAPPFLIPSRGYAGNGDDEQIRMALVRWTPHSLCTAEPAAVTGVIRGMEALQVHRGLNLDELCEWCPSPDDLAAIRFAIERNQMDWLKDAFLDSVHSGVGSMADRRRRAAVSSPPMDLASAIEQLEEVMLDTSSEQNRRRRNEALQNYRRIAAQQLTGPMLRKAEQSADPVDRAIQAQFAQLNALFLDKMPMVREQMLRGSALPRADGSQKESKWVAELLAISGQMVALAREMKKWSPRHTKTPPKPAAGRSSGHSPRFTASDLTSRN